MQIGQGVTPTDLDILGDPQTSGGLLLAISEDKVDELVRRLHEQGALSAAVVGRCLKQEQSTIWYLGRLPVD